MFKINQILIPAILAQLLVSGASRASAGDIKIKKHTQGPSDADYCQHIMALRKKVPQGFSVFIQKPFVVLGDGDPAMLEDNYVLGTIKRSAEAYKSMYFKNDPPRIIDVWLFKDADSYNRYTARLFGDRPDTPFGYYSPQSNALIMNIATGGGTLVHEMFHAFVSGNFPECPAWFNEGYASLYEQSQFDDNAIFGLTNWRLAELQNGIRHNELLSFQEFCGQDSRQFYSGSRHNYAQARYLALYLQAKGLLVKYYRAFYQNRKTDPTGYRTLKEVLGEPDMDAFQKQWEKWVLGLKFPPSYLPAA